MTHLQNPTPLAMPDQAEKSLASCPKGGNNAADQVKVTAVTHWTDKLFSFQTDRPPSFRFQSGEFAMIGLADNDGKAITRAYSIASPNWDDHLEFYSIIVPDGPLTSRLRHVQIGDDIILRPKTTGTLNLARLRDGKRLYLLATGTGFAPFASLIRDPETYERFDEVILVHGCHKAELGWRGKDSLPTAGSADWQNVFARTHYNLTVKTFLDCQHFHGSWKIQLPPKLMQICSATWIMICGSSQILRKLLVEFREEFV